MKWTLMLNTSLTESVTFTGKTKKEVWDKARNIPFHLSWLSKDNGKTNKLVASRAGTLRFSR